MKIPFNKPPVLGPEIEAIQTAIQGNKLSGDGPFNKKCATWFQDNLKCKLAIPTPSCTAALEMGLMLIGIKLGDEVILPSFTFTSTATSIVLHGGTPVFIDSRPDTLNMDETLIKSAITNKTKAIMPVHYGGVSCNMTEIMKIADEHGLTVLEDAAQCIWAFDRNTHIGTQGHMSAFSFHETKNITCGEGGMLCINDKRFVNNAEIARDKGTNRQQFFRGDVDKYSWQDKGSSYLMSEIQAACLSTQLEAAQKITQNRLETWNHYHNQLEGLEKNNKLHRPVIPENTEHNAHLYYILLPSETNRAELQSNLAEKDIYAAPHYVPLHASTGGRKFGREGSKMSCVNDFSGRLLRLPLYYGLQNTERKTVTDNVKTMAS